MLKIAIIATCMCISAAYFDVYKRLFGRIEEILGDRFAVHAIVRSDSCPYRIEILKFFRPYGETIYLSSYVPDDCAKVKLEKGKTYLLGGYISYDFYFTPPNYPYNGQLLCTDCKYREWTWIEKEYFKRIWSYDTYHLN
ncbi:unnamed protein product [Cylicostephanus goldi]|uniref:Uncharacterized protein n=1 Tax=Cylicostephanus goldi TaxID=71465 RepID=A0A3P6RUR8_CYLGO|nr:unnamed protein product [Cylicostephanus goldi]